MKRIVLVIARNEENNIKQCLDSLLNQTIPADQIVVLVHNSNDNTQKIASQIESENSSVYVVGSITNDGVPYARIAALDSIKKQDEAKIFCIDGDSIAQRNWIETLDSTLKSNENIMVGSFVKFTGHWSCPFFNFLHWWCTSRRNKRAIQWIWGGSFAFRSSMKNIIVDFLKQSISLTNELNLSNPLEDYVRALLMNKIGNIQVVNSTFVTTTVKEKSLIEMLIRQRNNLKNKYKIDQHFK